MASQLRQTYLVLLSELGLPEVCADVASGRLEIQSHRFRPIIDHVNATPEDFALLAPALIPLTVTHGGFRYGWVSHYFVNRRKVIVRTSPDDWRWLEWATDLSQFMLIVNFPDEDDGVSKSRDVAHRLGLNDADVESFKALSDTNSSGLPLDLKSHRQFRDYQPAAIYCDWDDNVSPHYSGDFPYPHNLDSVDLTQFCSHEVPDVVRATIRARADCPEWLREDFGPKASQFVRRCVEQGDHRSAWMGLNSGNWDPSERYDAVQAYAKIVPDPTCKLQLLFWTSLATNANDLLQAALQLLPKFLRNRWFR